MVMGSMNDARPNCIVTAAINPSEAIFTPSRNALIHGECLMRGISGLLIATKMKDGIKIPMVASNAPGIPPSI